MQLIYGVFHSSSSSPDTHIFHCLEAAQTLFGGSNLRMVHARLSGKRYNDGDETRKEEKRRKKNQFHLRVRFIVNMDTVASDKSSKGSIR